jgi:beta-lactamase regulating signal transducer with metallopeptidase domain
VLPSRRLFAYGIAGQPSQVVVSDGLVDTLAEEELAAVLRHEATHLRHHHERQLLVASVVEHTLGAVPLIRRSVAVLRCALERWADEEAATSDADRASVRSALLRVTEAMVAGEVVAFVTAATVAERIEALEAARPRSACAWWRALV